MARRRKKGRSRRKKKVAVLPLLGTVPGLIYTWEGSGGGTSVRGGVNHFVHGYTGFNLTNNQFEIDGLKKGALPLVLGIGGSMLASRIGLNRYLSRVPIVGKSIRF